MIILLDENFPLRFYTRLQNEALSAQHILLTNRGIYDRQIIARLKREELLFLPARQRPTTHFRCLFLKALLSPLLLV
jgi:hypothetical protein